MKRISKNNAPLSIGIQHFDSLATHRTKNIPRSITRSRRHILNRRNQCDNVLPNTQACRKCQRVDNCRPTGHIHIHPQYRFRRLEIDTTRIKCDALPDKYYRRFSLFATLIFHDDKFCRHIRSFPNAKHTTHFESRHVLFLQNLYRNTLSLCHSTRLISERLWRHITTREISKSPTGIHFFPDYRATSNALLK